MGNCCRPASPMELGRQDWGSLKTKNTWKTSSSKVFDEGQGLSLGNAEKEKLLGMLRASSDANGKVKIKISKKELAELLGGIEKQQQMQMDKHIGRASAEKVLLRLMNARDHANHHTPWRPVLDTIPEVN